MKRLLPLLLSLSVLTFSASSLVAAGEEDQCIATLQSAHSLPEIDAACLRLKSIGTPRCVPALAALLTQDAFSQSARYALGSMPGAEAEAALLDALAKTSGSNQVGLINSLAARRDATAVPALGKLLAEADTNISCSAAMGLGLIGGPEALHELQSAWSDTASGSLHRAEIDGLLACAHRLLKDGQDAAALEVFQRLYQTAKDDGARQAAFCGVILASGSPGIALMADAIAGHDGPSQGAALQVALQMPGAEATRALADLLPKVEPAAQIALLTCLRRREDPSALQAVAQMAGSPDADVRLAAFNALGELGDGSVAALLAQKAAAASGEEKMAARTALLEIHRGDVTPALLEAFAAAAPEAKAELIRALGDRGDTAASPRLLEMARSQDDATRSSSLQALALLAGPAQLPGLVQLVVQAPSDDARSEAADALNSACQHIQALSGHCDAEALVQALQTGPLEARAALLPICSGLAEAPVRQALRAALADPEPRAREAALRALCDTCDAELLPDLLKTAGGASDAKTRLLAVRGAVRLATQQEGVSLSDEQKLEALKTILHNPLEASEKRLVLSGLAAIPDDQSLALALTMLDDPAVKPEAVQSVLEIAGAVAGAQPEEAKEALKKVTLASDDPTTKAAVEQIQKKIWKTTGYVTTWQIAGPYEQQGKGFRELFDIPFPPETGASPVQWRKLPGNGQSEEPWKIDLLQAIGGLQRVAYARTWINSPRRQNVRMEIGSDDGIKIWLNNTVVHANNVARAVKPDSDKVDVPLKKGWNSLLLKVTQYNAGWGFCIRLAEPGGAPVTGLRAALNPAGARR